MKIEIKHQRIPQPAKNLVLRSGIFANGFLDFPFFLDSWILGLDVTPFLFKSPESGQQAASGGFFS